VQLFKINTIFEIPNLFFGEIFTAFRMEPLLIQYKNSAIAYHRFGEGPCPLLCFHGYGEQAGMFDFLGRYAGDQYTLIAIDLPFHGKTEWNEGLNFSAEDLRQICNDILLVEIPSRILRDQIPKFSLLGFSLGGRIALSLYQVFPERIEKMVLLAPDGLKVNFWYWLSTQTLIGNKFFAFTMKRPGWFFGLLKLMNRLRLVNASIFKFVNYYIGDAEVRQLLYARWTSLRKLKPDLRRIKKAVRDNKTPVRLLYGKHDRIILPSVGEKFQKEIEPYCTLSIISSGHQVLHEKHVKEIMQSLKL
jgi:pimeloyl-ACP methyl ester carboxylesterase